MAGFVYYLPHVTRTISPEQIRAAGLAYALPRRIASAGVARGPDGGGGIVFADGDRVDAGAVGYFPDRQEWMQAPGGLAWVGLDRAARPGPDDLVRPETLDGHRVLLGDGLEWLIPAVRGWQVAGERACLLPKAATLDAAGNWASGEILEPFAGLWDAALRWWDSVYEAAQDDRASFTYSGLFDAAVVALQAHYRVGKVEAALLKLLTTKSAVAVMDAVADMPTVKAWADPKDGGGAAGSATAPGPQGDSPDTHRP
jgi:hypothetical protein